MTIDLWKVMQAYTVISFSFVVQKTHSTVDGLTYMDDHPAGKDKWHDDCDSSYWYPRPLPPHCYGPQPQLSSSTPKPQNCLCAEVACVPCTPCVPCIATCSWCVPGCAPSCRPCSTCSNQTTDPVLLAEHGGVDQSSFKETPYSYNDHRNDDNNDTLEEEDALGEDSYDEIQDSKGYMYGGGRNPRGLPAALEDLLQDQIVCKELRRRQRRRRIRSKINRKIQKRRRSLQKMKDLLEELKNTENEE